MAFYKQKATSDFWDNHWQRSNLEQVIRNAKSDPYFSPLIKKYLPQGSKVLEGGCGMGIIVNAMQYQGYEATGIDFAKETVSKVNSLIPELDVKYGDVRELPFADSSFDGYVSGGVIEHFWGGYDKIIEEMARVLKTGGYLFISFPYMSSLRKLKALFHGYSWSKYSELDDQKQNFYQFALNYKEVVRNCEKLGLKLIEKSSIDGLKGLKDEVEIFHSKLQKIYDHNKGGRFRGYLDRLLKTFAGHGKMLVFRKA